MTRGEALLSAAVVFVAALAVRAVAAAAIVFPLPEDTSYYVTVARHLLDGRGLVTDALWNFHVPVFDFPRPAFDIWLPLPAFLAALPMALLGPSFAVAQIGTVLVGALVPVLAWRLAADVAEERRLPRGRALTLALGSGLTAAVYLPLVLHSALPDSTMPFAALVLAACLLMTRLAGDPRGAGLGDPRAIALGVTLGLAALARNEAAWLALVWVGVAWWMSGATLGERLRLIGVPAIVALAIYAPWALRSWAVFATPLPGQALTNALSITGYDLFAWADPPTLQRYLSVGPAELVRMRIDGSLHNLVNVLLLLGIPAAVVGLLALPWFGRARALRPLLSFGLVVFAATSLLFPVSTTWGTFLHAAGAVHVLLLVSALLAIDAGIARLGRRRGWTRPVAWLGPAFAAFGSVVLTVALLPGFAATSTEARDRYRALGDILPASGMALGRGTAPVISDYPIWLADTTGTPTLALPDEPPAAVLDLAAASGARFLVVREDPATTRRHLAGLLAATRSDPCFEPLVLDRPANAELAAAIDDVRAFRIVCP